MRELEILLRAVREARDDHARDLASAIAFWAFFSIFPLLMVILSAASHLLASAELKQRIAEVASDMLPGSALLVRDNLEAIVRYRGTMTWVGIAGLLWAASRGFGAVSRAINRTLGVRRADTYLLSSVRSFLMTLAVSILIIVLAGVALAIELTLQSSLPARLGLGAMHVPRLPAWALSLSLVFLALTVIYRFAPSVDVRWRQAWPGALLAAILFELGKAAFVVYLDRLADFEALYGSLTSITVLLLWLYLSALVLVLGAEYNIARARAGTPEGGGGVGSSS